MEFDRRRWGAILKGLILAALYSLPLALAVRLGLHFGDAVPLWLMIGGGLLAVFCLLGLIIQLTAAVVGLTWRSRLIFSPGRILWQRRSALEGQYRVFELADIAGLAVTRRGGGSRTEETLEMQYRQSDGVQAVAALLHSPGPSGTCLWAADLILDALAPRTVPFHRS